MFLVLEARAEYYYYIFLILFVPLMTSRERQSIRDTSN